MGPGGGSSQMVSWHFWTVMESSPQLSTLWASRILQVTQFAYPVVLLTVFLVTLMVHSIRAGSKSTTKSVGHAETDGEPVPDTPTSKLSKSSSKRETELTRAQKGLFIWLSAVLTATFIGNAVNIIVHALTQRPWWCGEAPVVSYHYIP